MIINSTELMIKLSCDDLKTQLESIKQAISNKEEQVNTLIRVGYKKEDV